MNRKRALGDSTVILHNAIADLVNNIENSSPIFTKVTTISFPATVNELIETLPMEFTRAVCAIQNHIRKHDMPVDFGFKFNSISPTTNSVCCHVLAALHTFLVNPLLYDGTTPFSVMCINAETTVKRALGTSGSLALLTDEELRKRIGLNIHAVSVFRGTDEFSRHYYGSSSSRIAAIHDKLLTGMSLDAAKARLVRRT